MKRLDIVLILAVAGACHPPVPVPGDGYFEPALFWFLFTKQSAQYASCLVHAGDIVLQHGTHSRTKLRICRGPFNQKRNALALATKAGQSAHGAGNATGWLERHGEVQRITAADHAIAADLSNRLH